METQSFRKKGCIETASETNYLIKLPDDLLIEVFLRASVKSLICAKCVCKQWYALIKNPDFEINQIRYQKIHDKGRLLLQYFKKDIYHLGYALFDDEALVSNTYHELDNFVLGADLCRFHMEGPVNGLYCLFDHQERIILWNPALSEFKTLPLPDAHFIPCNKVKLGMIGFGIDPLTHDYKLVHIRHLFGRNRFEYGTNIIEREEQTSFYVTVCNLSKNTWRLLDIGDFRLCGPHLSMAWCSSFLNGEYYWWDHCGFVITFNMGKEDFRHIAGPNFSDPKPLDGHLTLYNDNLALIARKQDLFLDIWVMLEEGVWIKKFNITTPESFTAIGIWKNSLVLTSRGSDTWVVEPTQMAMLDMNTQEMRLMGPTGIYYFFRACVYYESLVSVGCGTKHKGTRASLDSTSNLFSLCHPSYFCG